MIPQSVVSMLTTILAIIAAVVATLPYPWAHTAAVAISAGIGGIHTGVTVYHSIPAKKENTNG